MDGLEVVRTFDEFVPVLMPELPVSATLPAVPETAPMLPKGKGMAGVVALAW